MSLPNADRPDLPEYMTWEELEQLPEEIAENIELWDGRVIWLRRGPSTKRLLADSRTHSNAVLVKRCQTYPGSVGV